MAMDTEELNTILCCECAAPTPTNATNMCIDCVRSRVDITEGIARQVAQNHCRGCDRYERQGGWVQCELESKELLAILLKRVRGLDKVRLVDASFIWTEAHSKRIKLKLTVQKEVIRGAVLEQSLVVEFVVANRQCEKCQRVEAQDYWVSVVQVRQKVPHKRTIFWLEQLILRHGAHADATSIAEMRDGIDFYHSERNHSEKLVSFLQTISPLRYKTSKQMITQDTHTGVYRNKHTFSLEVVPVCKDDLVCLPKDTAEHLSNVFPLVLCQKVANNLHFVDTRSLRLVELSAPAFFKKPFRVLCARDRLREFVVLDVVPVTFRPGGGGRARPGHAKTGKRGTGEAHSKHGGVSTNLALADITVARVTDLGKNDVTFTVLSHLGGVLKAGDHAKGYDLAGRDLDTELDLPALAGKEDQIPDIVLVRKAYASAKRRRRVWRLKQLRKEADSALTAMDVERSRRDYDAFIRDLEEDKDMRKEVNLYRDPAAIQAMEVAGGAKEHGAGGDEEDEDALSEADVGLEELLDDLTLGDNEAFGDETGEPAAQPGDAGTFKLPDGSAGASFHFT